MYYNTRGTAKSSLPRLIESINMDHPSTATFSRAIVVLSIKWNLISPSPSALRYRMPHLPNNNNNNNTLLNNTRIINLLKNRTKTVWKSDHSQRRSYLVMLHFARSLNPLSSDITDRSNIQSERSTDIARPNERRDSRCSDRKLWRLQTGRPLDKETRWTRPLLSSCLNLIAPYQAYC